MSDEQFVYVRRRINHLEHSIWQNSSAIENVDWRSQAGDRTAEYQSMMQIITAAESELRELNKLLDTYRRRTMVMTPRSVLTLTAVVITIFIFMTLAAAFLAGNIHAW